MERKKHKYKIRESVGAFIVDNKGRFLLLKTKGEGEIFWDILKGGIEKGENQLEALKRELKEELGIEKFKNIQKLGISFTFEFPDKVKKKIGFDKQRVELFLVEFCGEEDDIKIDKKEILGFVFLDKEEFLKKVTYDTTRNAFLKMLKKLKL